jgi:peptidoglycan/xylan/chitin deacetylase (PgdA/CDA1 family)
VAAGRWRRFKRVSLQAIKSVGGFELLLDSAWRRRRLLILCYHGISIDDEHEWNPDLYMPPAGLRTRLEILRDSRCSVLPLADAVDRLYAGTLPERSVVLTFDDGYFDFHQEAFPLLQAFDVPATVYLTTLRCGWARPIFRLACAYMLWKARGHKVELPQGDRGEPATFDLTTPAGRARALEALIVDSNRQPLDMLGKDRFASRIGEWLNVDYEAITQRRMLTIMTPDEVRTLAAAGVDFQLHTHTHNTPSEPTRFDSEINRNRDAIEAMTGQSARHFCYPSGAYRPEFLPWLSEGQVVSATTCDPGLASGRSHPLLLPRFVDVTSITPVEFQGWLSGAASLMSRHRSYADG